MNEINKLLYGANGKIKAVYLGTTPVVVYLGDQLLYNVDTEEEDSWQYYKTGYILTGLIVSGGNYKNKFKTQNKEKKNND